jgi:hypothetical protein
MSKPNVAGFGWAHCREDLGCGGQRGRRPDEARNRSRLLAGVRLGRLQDAANNGCFAVRVLLAKSVAEAARFIAQRGGLAEGARLIAQIASRFGVAAQAVLARSAVRR